MKYNSSLHKETLVVLSHGGLWLSVQSAQSASKAPKNPAKREFLVLEDTEVSFEH